MAVITIATSIVPRNFELQQSAIESWRNSGFKVISLNSAEEAAVVAENFPGIPIKLVGRTAEAVTGKPYVYFDDVRIALLDEQSEVCGIVNSDIFLMAAPGFAEFVCETAKCGLLFGSRIDIDSLENLDGEKFIYGFDFFFFDRSALERFPRSEFCLGAPWWDYWAPIVPVLLGMRCRELVSPVAFHVRHETKWASNLFTDFGKMFADKIVHFDQNLSHLLTNVKVDSPEKLTRFSFDILVHILKNTDKVYYPNLLEKNSVIEVGQSQYLKMRERVIEHNKSCFEQREQVNELKSNSLEMMQRVQQLEASLLAYEARLATFRTALSWRISRPLRWLGDKVRSLVKSERGSEK